MDDIETTFRSRSEDVVDAFRVVSDELEDRTNNEKYGLNAKLNFSIIIAAEYIEEKNEVLEAAVDFDRPGEDHG